ncbi:hypothetical protein DFH07DRAFT_90092 [Mycena maculata]|uniref:Uncharacterized protein n=1 Tax=Mycena maculata TaxID=230809 RepID=A0AAD7I948_9AGAR|nr:hypothetical protein DFH07DRAFT_90092 [Mycena maculata]
MMPTVQKNTSLPPSNCRPSRPRRDMDFPQELISKIIDETSVSPLSLRSCALVAHPFVYQSQMHLFAQIEQEDESPASSRRFSELLLLSPHLALHVRSLSLECNSENWDTVSTILSAVSRVTHVKLLPKRRRGRGLPQRMRVPFRAPFAFPSLRAIKLSDYLLGDVVQFDSLFLNTPELESLELENLAFKSEEPEARSAPLTGASAPVLSKLTLRHMARGVVDSIMDWFTVVDVRHLHSLFVYDSPISTALWLNALTLRDVRIACVDSEDTRPDMSKIMSSSKPHDSTVLALKFLFLDPSTYDNLPKIVRVFDDLHRCTELETVMITFNRCNDYTYVSRFDTMLRVLVEAGTLKRIKVYLGDTDFAVPSLRSWMSLLDAAGVLDIVTAEEFYACFPE